ncbi:recombinase family protein [Oricola indica]|uniref:recombinase family protein n=1 Tax=Oricola indica TaxID=2872591 RepID=UPI001CBABDFC|nr:recombinase family protein [Oricola indica]
MSARRIGYLRVSTAEQRPDRQIDGLRHICDELHIEKISATSKRRAVYESVIAGLQPGDFFVIWDLDRAFRSAKDALVELDRLRERGIEIQIANLSIDTATPYGMLLYTFVSGLAEFERRLLSQRTREGLAAARGRGVRLGRPPKMTAAQIKTARKKLAGKHATTASVAAFYGVHPWTLRRAINRLDTQLTDA